eukprot:6179837-Pleurochrysis_carterae.AAC.1
MATLAKTEMIDIFFKNKLRFLVAKLRICLAVRDLRILNEALKCRIVHLPSEKCQIRARAPIICGTRSNGQIIQYYEVLYGTHILSHTRMAHSKKQHMVAGDSTGTACIQRILRYTVYRANTGLTT